MAETIDQLNEELKKFGSEIANTLRTLKKAGPGSVEAKRLELQYQQQIKAVKDLNEKYKNVAGSSDVLNKQLAKAQVAYTRVNEVLNKQIQAEKKRESDRETIWKKHKEAIKGLGTAFVGLADASTTGTSKLGYFTKSFEGTVLAPFNILAKSLDYNIDNYKSLASYGADFGKSLLGLREAARDAQLPLEEFKNLVGRNAPTLAALYGTTNQGAVAMANLSNVIRKQAQGSLFELGLTTEQLLEYQNTYLSRQQMQGRRDFLNNEMAAAQVENYAKELNTLSRLTGIQNSELDKQVKEQLSDGVFNAYLSSLDEKQAMQTQNLIATLSAVNPALGTTAKNLLATGVPLDDLGQELTALAPGFQEAVLAFKQSGDVAGTLQRLRDSAQGFQSRFQGTAGAATLLAGGLSNASNSVVQLASMNMDLAKAQEQQRKAADPLTKELAKFEDSARRFKAGLEGIPTEAIGSFANTLGVGIGGLNTGLNNLSKAMHENPKRTAAILGGIVAAKYGANILKEIGIVYQGTKMALATSPMGAGLPVGKGSAAGGGMLAKTGTMLAAGGAAITGINDIVNIASDDKKANTLGWAGVAGGTLGATLGFAMGGPPGAYLGYMAGSMLSSTLAASMDSKAIGGGLTINKPTMVGERGPELILPKTSGQVVPLMSGANKDASLSSAASAITGTSVDLSVLQSTMSSVRDILAKSENHLNKLVSVGLTQVKSTEDVKTAVSKQSGFAYVG